MLILKRLFFKQFKSKSMNQIKTLNKSITSQESLYISTKSNNKNLNPAHSLVNSKHFRAIWCCWSFNLSICLILLNSVSWLSASHTKKPNYFKQTWYPCKFVKLFICQTRSCKGEPEESLKCSERHAHFVQCNRTFLQGAGVYSTTTTKTTRPDLNHQRRSANNPQITWVLLFKSFVFLKVNFCFIKKLFDSNIQHFVCVKSLILTTSVLYLC